MSESQKFNAIKAVFERMGFDAHTANGIAFDFIVYRQTSKGSK